MDLLTEIANTLGVRIEVIISFDENDIARKTNPPNMQNEKNYYHNSSLHSNQFSILTLIFSVSLHRWKNLLYFIVVSSINEFELSINSSILHIYLCIKKLLFKLNFSSYSLPLSHKVAKRRLASMSNKQLIGLHFYEVLGNYYYVFSLL